MARVERHVVVREVDAAPVLGGVIFGEEAKGAARFGPVGTASRLLEAGVHHRGRNLVPCTRQHGVAAQAAQAKADGELGGARQLGYPAERFEGLKLAVPLGRRHVAGEPQVGVVSAPGRTTVVGHEQHALVVIRRRLARERCGHVGDCEVHAPRAGICEPQTCRYE